jgi:hypothetical protein
VRGKRILRSFPVFGCQRDFRDGTDGEADRPAGLGVRGIPGVVADSGVGAAGGGRRPECGRCRRDSRHACRG